jgi:hypothetical protein
MAEAIPSSNAHRVGYLPVQFLAYMYILASPFSRIVVSEVNWPKDKLGLLPLLHSTLIVDSDSFDSLQNQKHAHIYVSRTENVFSSRDH